MAVQEPPDWRDVEIARLRDALRALWAECFKVNGPSQETMRKVREALET